MTYLYRITVRPLSADDGGGWLAEVPDLPGCMSDGPTPAAAVESVQDAIGCWIEATEEDGRPVPVPSVHARRDGADRFLTGAARRLEARN